MGQFLSKICLCFYTVVLFWRRPPAARSPRDAAACGLRRPLSGHRDGSTCRQGALGGDGRYQRPEASRQPNVSRRGATAERCCPRSTRRQGWPAAVLGGRASARVDGASVSGIARAGSVPSWNHIPAQDLLRVRAVLWPDDLHDRVSLNLSAPCILVHHPNDINCLRPQVPAGTMGQGT